MARDRLLGVQHRRAKESARAARRAVKAAERASRAAYFDGAADQTPLLAAETPLGRFVVHTRDRRISRSVFLTGRYAGGQLPRVLELLDQHGLRDVRAGRLLDVGANIGTVSIPAVVAHGFAGAVAIEAHPDNARLLRMNVAYNDLEDRVTVIHAAASDNNGEGLLHIKAANLGAHMLVGDGIADKQTITVPLRTIDSLELADVTIACFDIQGHEARALAGAGTLLGRIPIVAEFYPAMLGPGLAELLALAQAHYTQFSDLAGDTRQARPITELGALADELGQRFTDVLLLP